MRRIRVLLLLLLLLLLLRRAAPWPRWCPGGVPVVSRWCPGGFLVVCVFIVVSGLSSRLGVDPKRVRITKGMTMQKT